MSYQQQIRARLASQGYIGQYDPRHIEAYIRLEHSTLSNISPEHFNFEIEIARMCIDEDGKVNAEKCAESFGL